MAAVRELNQAWDDAKYRVIEAALVWHAYSEPRRADRMTHEEIGLYDAVTAMLTAGTELRSTGLYFMPCPRCHRMVILNDDGSLEAHTQADRYDRPCHARWPNEHVR
jgi:hypothetical protein